MSSLPQASWIKRTIATFIDFILIAIIFYIISLVFGAISSRLGHLLGYGAALVATLMRDALPLPALNGTSPGKKIFGLKALKNGKNCTLEDSAKRNLPFALGYLGGLFLIIPLIGWFIWLLLAIAGGIAVIVELITMITRDGKRFGDMFADTTVFALNEPPASTPPVPPAEAPPAEAGTPPMPTPPAPSQPEAGTESDDTN